MNKLLLLAVLFFAALESRSQQVIGSTGGEGTVGSMNINYTVGEMAITTISNDSSTLTQGFHQPYFVITAIEEALLTGEIKIFPNPTTSVIQVRFKDIELKSLSISLHDPTGRSIIASNVNSPQWQTDLSDLPGGFYILTVTDTKNNKRNSYKIFKSN